MNVLVVGGTGPSGPHVVSGLLGRGHEVTILHRGVHEPDARPAVRHIHADPHFAEPVKAALGSETFDAVIAMYGRLQVLAEVFAGRCARFLSVGAGVVYPGFLAPESAIPYGMKVLARESDPLPGQIGDSPAGSFVAKARAAEQAVMAQHAAGAYRATHIRYPYIYGPRSVSLQEWSIIRRLRDGRRRILLPHAGLGIHARCSARNAAHCLLLALDTPEAAGQIFNCQDDDQYSLRQWAELIARAMGAEPEFVDAPMGVRWITGPLLAFAGTASDHRLSDASKARALLGYRDALAAAEALAETVRWYLEHPLDAAAERALGDRFDYALEDRICDELAALAERFASGRPAAAAEHPYPHPKVAALGADQKGR